VLFLARGALHFNQGELGRSADDFRAAHGLKPEHYHAPLNLAHVALAWGRFEEAAEQAAVALRLRAPEAAVAGYQAEPGRAPLRYKRYEEALQACAEALRLAPGQAPPYEVRGRALLALGRYAEAEGAFDQYLRHGEETADVFRGRGLARMK